MVAEPENKELRPKPGQESTQKDEGERNMNQPRNEPTQPREISRRDEGSTSSFGSQKTNARKDGRNT